MANSISVAVDDRETIRSGRVAIVTVPSESWTSTGKDGAVVVTAAVVVEAAVVTATAAAVAVVVGVAVVDGACVAAVAVAVAEES